MRTYRVDRIEGVQVTNLGFDPHYAIELSAAGEYVGVEALTSARTWVRYGGPGAAPVTTDGPHPETSDLIAGW